MSDHEKNKRIVEAARKENTRRTLLHDKIKLKDNAHLRFKTTMIGALAAVEEQLGYLWGIDVAYEELTEDQLDIQEKWLIARADILDNGNNQERILEAEIDKHEIKYVKPSIHFKLNNRLGNQDND